MLKQCRRLTPALCAFSFFAALSATASAQFVKDGPACYTLYAGQNIDAGSVCVTISGGNLVVTYETTGGWELTEAHLWIGNSITDLPQTKTGNPVPGQFPYKSGDITGATSYAFSIPLSNPAINFTCPSNDVIYLLAAHAALRLSTGPDTWQTETGWSAGSPITTRGNWATFSTFTLTCFSPSTGGGDPVCETAFARATSGAVCFNDIGFARWGWTNGPYGPGTYVLDIYAGAGQCDTNNGPGKVGTLTVVYDGATATATYAMEDGFFMLETHLYIGSTRLPLMKQGKSLVETVAPGQYPYQHSLEGATTDVYTVAVTGPIYIVAHAVTCQ